MCVRERVCACLCCTISSTPHICVCIYILHTRIQIQGVVATFSASWSSLFFSSQPLTLAFHTWQLKLVSLVSRLFLSLTHTYTRFIVAHSLIISLSIVLQWNKQLPRLFEPDLIIIHSPEVPVRPFSISVPFFRSLPLSFFVCYSLSLVYLNICIYVWWERCLLTESPETPGHYRYLIWVLVYMYIYVYMKRICIWIYVYIYTFMYLNAFIT